MSHNEQHRNQQNIYCLIFIFLYLFEKLAELSNKVSLVKKSIFINIQCELFGAFLLTKKALFEKIIKLRISLVNCREF